MKGLLPRGPGAGNTGFLTCDVLHRKERGVEVQNTMQRAYTQLFMMSFERNPKWSGIKFWKEITLPNTVGGFKVCYLMCHTKAERIITPYRLYM